MDYLRKKLCKNYIKKIVEEKMSIYTHTVKVVFKCIAVDNDFYDKMIGREEYPMLMFFTVREDTSTTEKLILVDKHLHSQNLTSRMLYFGSGYSSILFNNTDKFIFVINNIYRITYSMNSRDNDARFNILHSEDLGKITYK